MTLGDAVLKLDKYSPAQLKAATGQSIDWRIPPTQGGQYCIKLPVAAKIRAAALDLGTIEEAKTQLAIKEKYRRDARYGKLYSAAEQSGFRRDVLSVVVAIGFAEGGTIQSTCYNLAGRCVPTWRPGITSIDRGPWQINNRAHPDVTEKCARDYTCAAQVVWRLSRGGKSFRPWSSYNSGSYKHYLIGA